MAAFLENVGGLDAKGECVVGEQSPRLLYMSSIIQ